jgi:Asp-tRNA(Asn)/Glu-tRNA(Gln) amidotransferase A subunit family amidase
MLSELAGAVRDGKVSPRELVEESLRRIDEANPDLNAVIARRDDEARAEADSLSDERRAGPLAGVPLLVKDLSNVAGMRTTFGSPLSADAAPARTDSTIVARLRAAGAIVVGKTNTPAFGWTGYTDNQLFGATRNPWNTECSPGGSSGGSAAALAAALAPLATTTDGGGSVRIPASMCGLVGYKPSLGTIARDRAPNWITFSTSGATSATVADVVLEAEVLAGPNGGDINELPRGSVSFAATAPSRVVACRSFRADVEPAVDAAFTTTLAVLADDLGLAVEQVDDVFPDESLPLSWFVIGSAELAQALAAHEDRWDDFEPGLAGLLRFGKSVSLADYLAAQRTRYEAAATLEALLGADGVLVTPTLNVTSWSPTGPLPDCAGAVTGDPSIAVNTLELNFTGHPGVSVPMGRSPEGVPIGLQVAAPRFRDELALGVAAQLEQAQPWPLTAPGYEPFAI